MTRKQIFVLIIVSLAVAGIFVFGTIYRVRLARPVFRTESERGIKYARDEDKSLKVKKLEADIIKTNKDIFGLLEEYKSVK